MVKPKFAELMVKILLYQALQVPDRFSDYRQEASIQVARKQTRLMNGEQIMTINIETFELNPKIDPALFKKPAG